MPTGVTANVTSFPLLIRLNGKIANGGNANDSLVFVTAKSNQGWDIRFTKSNATDSIPFEIERYDSTNMLAEFWVRVDTVSYTASTTFRMYWGRSTGTSAIPSTPPGVFSSSVVGPKGGVWHFGPNNYWGDATGNGNAAVNGGTLDTTGICGRARWFNVNDPDSIKVQSLLDSMTDTITMSCWINLTAKQAGADGQCYPVSVGNDLAILDYATPCLEGRYHYGTGGGYRTTGTAVPTILGQGWQYVAYVINQGTSPYQNLYVNGTSVATDITDTNAVTYTARV